jgi:hypothetical protein
MRQFILSAALVLISALSYSQEVKTANGKKSHLTNCKYVQGKKTTPVKAGELDPCKVCHKPKTAVYHRPYRHTTTGR